MAARRRGRRGQLVQLGLEMLSREPINLLFVNRVRINLGVATQKHGHGRHGVPETRRTSATETAVARSLPIQSGRERQGRGGRHWARIRPLPGQTGTSGGQARIRRGERKCLEIHRCKTGFGLNVTAHDRIQIENRTVQRRDGRISLFIVALRQVFNNARSNQRLANLLHKVTQLGQLDPNRGEFDRNLV